MAQVSNQHIRLWTVINDGILPIADAIQDLLKLNRDAFDYVGSSSMGPCGRLSGVIFQTFTVHGSPGHFRLELIRDSLTVKGQGDIGNEIAERARTVVSHIRAWEKKAKAAMRLRHHEIERIRNEEKRRPEIGDLFGLELTDEFNEVYDEAEYFEKYLRRIAAMLGPKLYPETAGAQKPARTDGDLDGELVIDSEARKARWKNKTLPINSHVHFDILSALYADRNRILSYAKLLNVIKPGEASDSVRFTEVPSEVKLAVSSVRSAMKEVGCPIEIKAVKGRGYLLQSYE